MLMAAPGCTTPTYQTPQFAARHLSDNDMDRITAGEAYATSTASAQATGATAFTSVSDLSLVSSGSINGAPVVSYATLQGHALAAQAVSAQASAAGQLAISNGTTAGIEAATASAAKATGPDSRAQADIQLYATLTTNQTAVVFGSTDTLGCCAPQSNGQTPQPNSQTSQSSGQTSQPNGQAIMSIMAQGAYTEGKQVHRTGTTPAAAESGVDVAEVSSRLPLIDPSELIAASATRIAPRY
jgi:hypothetical protein